MPPLFTPKRLISLLAAFVIMTMASGTVWADPLTITTGNPNNQEPTTFGLITQAWFIPGLNGTTFSEVNQSRLGGFNTPSEVPEPASLLLLGSGLVGTAGALRRRLKNRSNQ